MSLTLIAPLYVWCPAKSSKQLNKAMSQMVTSCPVEVVLLDPMQPLPTLPAEGVLLMLGGAMLGHLREAGLVKKNKKTVTSCREQIIPMGDLKIMLSFDPFVTERESERMTDLITDVQLAARLATTGTLSPPIGDYEYVEDFSALCEYCNGDTGAGKLNRIAVDLETLGLDPFAPEARIISISMTAVEGIASVYYVPPDGKLPLNVFVQVARLLCNPRVKVMGANGKYDDLWMAVHWGIEGINWKFDTHLAGSLLDENRSNSLETHAKVYTPMGGYDSEFNRRFDKSRMDLVPKEDLLPYAGGDTDACFRVAKVQRRLLQQDMRLTRFFTQLLLPAAKVFTKLERRGIYVDRPRYQELEKECKKEIDLRTKEAFSFLPRRMLLKYADNLSLSRPEILREFLFTKRGLHLTPEIFTPKEELPSTALEHMQRFVDHPVARPFVEAMEKLGSATKTMGTYIVGFQKHIRADGMFHPTYRLGRGSSLDDPEGGTVTGRLSATDPAYQTIPKRTVWAKPLRSVYPCPSGMGIAKFDYGQGELRIMACLSEDPTMLRAYQKGQDIHALTAAAMMGMPFGQFLLSPEDVIEAARRAAKAVNFGLIYGMKPPGLKDYARKSYGVLMTPEESIQYWDTFFGTYKGLLPYHEKCKKRAHMHQMARSPLGRIRHLPLINGPDHEIRSLQERQAINSPIQSTLSDMMLMSMIEIDRRWPDIHIFGMTHDSVEMYLPLDHIEDIARDVRDVMQNLPLDRFDWTPQINFTVDAEIATEGTLADVKKVKL